MRRRTDSVGRTLFQPAEVGRSSSGQRLLFALLYAFAGCLNPLPEEYPSQTDSDPGLAGEMTNTPPASEDTSANPGGGSEPDSLPADSDDSPAVPEPEPDLDRGAADAGPGDAGVVDAGAPALRE